MTDNDNQGSIDTKKRLAAKPQPNSWKRT